MKDKSMRIIKFLLLMAAVPVLLYGCGSDKNTPIVTVNDKKLYIKDFLYDIYLVEKEGKQLEDYYQEKLGCSYWDFEYNSMTVREAAKSSVMASVVMYEILADQAAREGIALSREELSADEKAARDIIDAQTKEKPGSAALTYDIVKEACDKKALGDKYRKELVKSFHIDENAIRESLKPQDYREYKTECLFIPTVTVKDNEVLPLSNDETASAHTTITKALELLAEGRSMEEVLDSFDGLKYDIRNFVYGDKGYEEEYQTAAIALYKEELSKVTATEYGYYIIHMLDNNSSARYEQAVEDAVRAEEEEQFAGAYNEIKKQYGITVNFDYWDTVTIGQLTVPKN